MEEMNPPVNRIERGHRIGRYPFQVAAVVRQALAGAHLPLLIVPDLHEIRAVGFQFGMYQQHRRTHLARHAPAFDQPRAGERNDDADDDHRELQRIVAPCPVESGLPDRRPVRRTGTPGAAVIPATAVCRAEVLAFTGSSAPGRGLPCAALLAARTLPHLGLPARPALRFGLRLVLRAIMLLVPLCAPLRSVLLSALRPSPSSVTTPGRFFRPVFRHLFRRLLRRIPRYFFIWHISPLFCTYALKILTVSTASRTSWTRRIAAPWRRHSHPRATVPARDWAGVTPSTR